MGGNWTDKWRYKVLYFSKNLFSTLKHTIIILLLLLLTGRNLFPQTDTAETKQDSSNTYYTDLSHLLALRVYTLLKLNTLEISNEESVALLRPNSPVSLGVGFNYKGLGIALGFGLPHSSANINKYGRFLNISPTQQMTTKALWFCWTTLRETILRLSRGWHCVSVIQHERIVWSFNRI